MSISDEDFALIRGLVQEHAGIVLENGKQYLVESRLNQLARQEGFSTLGHLLKQLHMHSTNSLRMKAVDAMTTNETSFFRDFHPFEALRTAILPELLEKRGRERRLNLWCGAASSGQEPYSIMMLLLEHFPALESWTVKFIASDFSDEMLFRAKQGRYSQLEVNRGLPAHLLAKYFQKQGDGWEVSQYLREKIEFSKINLVRPWPSLPSMDLILMRNVFIYFSMETKKDILSKLRRVLKPDGYLFLGATEALLNLDDAFESIQINRTMCYRLRQSFTFLEQTR